MRPFLTLLILSLPAFADWPMPGYDPRHSASTPHDLPDQLNLRWTINLPALEPAWPDQTRLKDDAIHHPLIVGQLMIVASPLDDSVAAYSLADGSEAWRFFTQGPIRATPASDVQRLFVGSDDGFMYALAADTGKLLWKKKAAPRTRLVLGNQRLIDTWPVRGGPVVANGRLYFAAGVWPFMGIFLHCVDSKTGESIWCNSGDGSAFMTQPHGDPSFAGTAPQGSLAIFEDKLLVPNGRSCPAIYDLKTGKLLAYNLANKFGGDQLVAASKDLFIANEVIFKMKDGKPVYHVPAGSILLDDHKAAAPTANGIETYPLDQPTTFEPWRKVMGVSRISTVTAPVAPGATCLIRAGKRLYAGGKGAITAINLPLDPQSPDPAWRLRVEGNVVEMIAANGALIAVTDKGAIHCLGAGEPAPAPTRAPSMWHGLPARVSLPADLPSAGYCALLGSEAASIARHLTSNPDLHCIVIEPNESTATQVRTALQRANLYGRRIAVRDDSIATLPRYFASLIIISDSTSIEEPGSLETIFRSLHPYHGVALLPRSLADRAHAFAKTIPAGHISVSLQDDWIKLSRTNGPPGAGNWTHENADPANTRVSKDSLAKAPLGILWFGGTNHAGTLPRHGHGPQPQVIDGRLILEGVDFIRCLDIYTGRLLWQTELPGVGSFFDNTAHQAGANGTGTNFISTSDSIYVVLEMSCVRLDLKTGKKLGEFLLPLELRGADALWGYLNVEGDYLIGGVGRRAKIKKAAAKTEEKPDPFEDPETKPTKATITNPRTASSNVLFVMNRHTGKLLWSTKATRDFRHNAVCAGGGRLFAIDLETSDSPLQALIKPKPAPGFVRCFDLASGRPMWSGQGRVFGTYLSFSAEHDVLMESGRKARDTLKDEPIGMRAYNARSGEVLWLDPKASGPAMINGRIVHKEHSAADLLTGEPVSRVDPLTGLLSEWTWTRNYGCNTPIASPHLMTFRSGAAGFYDLERSGGTGNIGGFRSGCTNNLIIAGGLVVAPDYTRTCTCSYQMQTSLALVHDPDAELWTFNGRTPDLRTRLTRIGVNLGAPGDRVDDNGTYWLEYPSVGGKSPVVKVKASDGTEYFRRHASLVSGPHPWVTASGAKNLKSISVALDQPGAEARPFTIRVYFAQPTDIVDTTASISIQGKLVEEKLNIAQAAGGKDKSLVREYGGIEVAGELVIDFKPVKGATPVLSGIEAIAEDPK